MQSHLQMTSSGKHLHIEGQVADKHCPVAFIHDAAACTAMCTLTCSVHAYVQAPNLQDTCYASSVNCKLQIHSAEAMSIASNVVLQTKGCD